MARHRARASRCQVHNDTPSLRTRLNPLKAIQLRAISAGSAPVDTKFSVDQLPLAALDEGDGLQLPATLTGHFSGSTSTTCLIKKRFENKGTFAASPFSFVRIRKVVALVKYPQEA
jgi:hypothetical protein